MAVDSYIDAYQKEPSASVRFNGNRSRDILSIDVTQSMDGLSSATIRLLSNPGVSPETKVQIKQGYNAQEVTTFTGLVDAIERSNVDNSYTVQARDNLKKALDTFLVQEVKFGIDVALQTFYYSTYDSADGGTFVVHEYTSLNDLYANHPETMGNITNEGAKAEAVVQWLLHMSGLAEGTEIQVDNTEFFIGDITPAKFHLTSVYDAAMQIANLIGWRVFCDSSGVCRFKKRPRNPSSFYPGWRYYDQQEPYNIMKLSRNESSVDLRTYVEVRGSSGIKYVARGTSPFLGTTPYRGVLISDELIDTPGMAKFVGDRVLSDLNRKKVTISLEADGNPKLVPGSTVDVNSKVSQGKYLVETVNTTESAEGGYRTSLTASAYYGDTAFEEPPLDIVANYTALSVISIGDPTYLVEFDGSSSYSSLGPITRYVWTFPDLAQDGDDATVWYSFKDVDIMDGNSVSITLQVFDGLGNTATVTSGITLAWLQEQADIKYRHMYGALNSVAVGSIDGGQNWNTLADLGSPALSVAASNFTISGGYVPSGYAIFGLEDGTIHKTVDACLTSYQVFAAAGAVLDMNIPELDSSFGAAGTEDGKVYRSEDFCETWTEIGDFAFPILQVKYNYTDFQQITILGSGNDNMYVTTDAGDTWTHISTGVNGLWMTDSNVKNYVAHTAGILNMSDSQNIPSANPMVAATYAINVDDALSPAAGLMTVDSTGQHFVYSGGLQATQFNPDNKSRHMIRDGDVPFLIYYANASGIGKSLDSNVTMSGLYYPSGVVPDGGWGYKVAYGPLAASVIPARLIWRGKQLLPGGLDATGFAYASSGWQLIPSSYANGEYISEAVSVAPGYVVYGTAKNIHYISVPTEGQPTAYINHAEIQVSNATHDGNGDHRVIFGLYISRKIIPSGQLPRVFALTGGNIFGVADVDIYPTFFTDPSAVDVITMPLSQTASNIEHPHAIPKNKDKILLATTENIFATSNTFYLIDIDSGEISLDTDKEPELAGHFTYPFENVALTTDWLTIGKHDQPSTLEENIALVNVTAPSYSVWDNDAEHPYATRDFMIVYESSILGSDIYYALMQDPEEVGAAPGVYKAGGYGLDPATLLLTIPGSCNKISAFSVTHDRAETRDYLSVVFDKTDGTGALVKYSTDGGVSWQNGPDIIYGTGSFTGGIWYVDT